MEQQPLAALERAAHLLPLHPGLHAERIRAGADAVDDLAAGDLHDLRMSGHGGDEGAVAIEKEVAAGEKRARAAGAAEDAIQRADDGARRRIDVELRPP